MKHIKRIAGIAVLASTLGAFFYSWRQHPELFRQLKHIQPVFAAAVIVLYGLMILLLTLIYDTTLQLCGHRLVRREQVLLTMYSSIVNFFGPLQSGPGVRTVYLKQRHKVSVKAYAAATVVYYLLFAAWSGLFLLSGITPWWRALAVFMALAAAGSMLLYLLRNRLKALSFVRSYSRTLLIRLAVLTLAQVWLVTIIYFAELQAVHAGASLHQATVYAGAANFSLFVSLTPGALGIREAFLLFSQRLHHLPSATIISANVFDRGIYILFLGILFLVVIGLHAQDRFKLRGDRTD